MLRKLGSIGTPIDGVRMRVVDEHGTEVTTGTLGDIQVRGHNLMKGYWHSPDATADAFADGWFSTGEIGLVDEDGCFHRRAEDTLIIRDGRRTSTRGQALCPNRLRFNER